jgi:hypothetical protein
VFADEVYAAGRDKDGGLRLEAGNGAWNEDGGIVHFSQNLSIEFRTLQFETSLRTSFGWARKSGSGIDPAE